MPSYVPLSSALDCRELLELSCKSLSSGRALEVMCLC